MGKAKHTKIQLNISKGGAHCICGRSLPNTTPPNPIVPKAGEEHAGFSLDQARTEHIGADGSVGIILSRGRGGGLDLTYCTSEVTTRPAPQPNVRLYSEPILLWCHCGLSLLEG